MDADRRTMPARAGMRSKYVPLLYNAAPGARLQEPGPVARLVGGGDNAQVAYAATPAAGTMTAARPSPPDGG